MNRWEPDARPITPEDSARYNAAKGAAAGEDDTTVEQGRAEFHRWSTRVGEWGGE